jgi:hypothetical protein
MSDKTSWKTSSYETEKALAVAVEITCENGMGIEPTKLRINGIRTFVFSYHSVKDMKTEMDNDASLISPVQILSKSF